MLARNGLTGTNADQGRLPSGVPKLVETSLTAESHNNPAESSSGQWSQASSESDVERVVRDAD